MKRVEVIHDGKVFYQSGISKRGELRLAGTKALKSKSISTLTKNFEMSSNTCLITLFSGVTETNCKNIIRFIKSNQIKTVYFFIEDVFRLYSKEYDFPLLDTYPLELTPDSIKSYELDIISSILNKSKCNYRLFHCENSADVLGKNYNLKIEYFDQFLIDCIYIKDAAKIALKNTKPSKKISCFNLRCEWHRDIIMSLIHNFNGTFSLNDPHLHEELINNSAIPLNRFSDNAKNKIISEHQYLSSNPIVWDAKIIKKTGRARELNPRDQFKNIPSVASAFVNVVTETRYSSFMPNVSEKTIKPMAVRRPFVLLGPVGTLAHLRSLGFKTFEKWWSEKYDQETDHSKRLEMVYDIVKSINDMSFDDLSTMLSEMSDVLDHNLNHIDHLDKSMSRFL